MVCHLGYEARLLWLRHPEAWLARSVATWKELAARAAAHRVTVMLENVYETEPELLLEVVGRVGADNLRVCLDVGHLYAFGGGDLSRWLHTLAPVIGQLHLHDNHGDRDAHLALGAGAIPLARDPLLPGGPPANGPSSPWNPTRKAACNPPWTSWRKSGPGRINFA